MNKTQLIEAVAKQGEMTKTLAGIAVDAVLTGIKTGLQEDGEVSLTGFGSFAVTEREARQGRNPMTGEAIQIAASKAVKFKAGQALKDAVA
ncbi:HU family DNA-binding protein [Cupriavidus gilardii]|uniref:HU family DNA-binding protein n=1 Tax=Cupriavidus gilardii TaxID=82541 RepID=UPI001EE6285A|nr:HU family DNA-binding protein [Cupriavidus gilardii]MCG5260394.1 HU family DNA-binding protein [Cupriavidus gilardii]MDF9428244.1 HU family DNA-binding protein [Cupriavidus gilardii]